jgi:hypothetical protein
MSKYSRQFEIEMAMACERAFRDYSYLGDPEFTKFLRRKLNLPPETETMAKRTVEIDDTLEDHVQNAIDEVKRELIEFLKANPDREDTPDIGNDLDYSGSIHEIVDGSVPIYTKEIDDTFYLYGSEIEEAFDDAGIGSKDDSAWPSGWKAAAIYCYIEQKVHEWYRNNADDVVAEYRAEHESEEEDDDAGDD